MEIKAIFAVQGSRMVLQRNHRVDWAFFMCLYEFFTSEVTSFEGLGWGCHELPLVYDHRVYKRLQDKMTHKEWSKNPFRTIMRPNFLWWISLYDCVKRLFRDWILLVCFSWRYEATEGPHVNFVMREALFEIVASYLHEKQTSRIHSLYLYFNYFIKIVPFWLRNIRF